MAESIKEVYELMYKVLISNPNLSPERASSVRDFLLNSPPGLLTSEEVAAVEAYNYSQPLGKHETNVARNNTIQTYGDLVEKEHMRSVDAKRKTTEAYNKDVAGSYQTAQQAAYDNSWTGVNRNPDLRTQFINKVRNTAVETFEKQRRDEMEQLASKYNLLTNTKIRAGDVGSVLDIPVTVANAQARDAGGLIGDIESFNAAGISGVFGKNSLLDKGFDKLETTGKKLDARVKDIKAWPADQIETIKASPLIQSAMKKAKNLGDKLASFKEHLPFYDLLHKAGSPWLRKLMSGLSEILGEWFHDPRTLCCLIKNLTAAAMANNWKTVEVPKKDDAGNPLRDGDGNLIMEDVEITTAILRGDYEFEWITATREFFDKLIVILEIIRDFLKTDLSFDFMLSMDLGMAISKASLSALVATLMALQQMLEDEIYLRLLTWVEQNTDANWRQCFPFEKLLRLIADWLAGPDGLFKYIERYVNGFLSEFSNNLHKGFSDSTKRKMVDVTALEKLIALLRWLRDAVLNFELCYEADFDGTQTLSDDASIGDAGLSIPAFVTPEDFDSIRGHRPADANKTGLKLGRIRYPTDVEIVAFVTNRMGETPEFAEQVLNTAARAATTPGTSGNDGAADSTKDNLAKQIEHAVGDCSRLTGQDRILELANLMSDWDLKI